MTETIRKPENPAKAFLRQYRARKIRMDSLSREIEKARERALSVTVRPKEVNVQGSHAAYDTMAEAVCKAADASETLYAEYQECNRVLAQIMAAISAVPDEMQKTVLTLRYVEGRSWEDIQDMIGYERTQTLVIHGRALWAVKKWMQKSAEMLTPEKKQDNLLISLANQFGVPNAPQNIIRYMQKWYCNMQININTVDVENGYGRRIIQNLRIMRPFCKCNRCGYHSLWNPDDSKSKCLRHTYEKGYDTVFTYTIDSGEQKAISLESAFDEYLRLNPNEDNGEAVVYYGI